MNTNLKCTHVRWLPLIAATLLATVTTASAADYEFKVTKAPVAGQPPAIELVNTATGYAVTGADIDVVQLVHLPAQKGVPNIQRVFVPLQTYLSGKDAYLNGKSQTKGEITLWASVPGEFWPVWRQVDLGN